MASKAPSKGGGGGNLLTTTSVALGNNELGFYWEFSLTTGLQQSLYPAKK